MGDLSVLAFKLSGCVGTALVGATAYARLFVRLVVVVHVEKGLTRAPGVVGGGVGGGSRSVRGLREVTADVSAAGGWATGVCRWVREGIEVGLVLFLAAKAWPYFGNERPHAYHAGDHKCNGWPDTRPDPQVVSVIREVTKIDVEHRNGANDGKENGHDRNDEDAANSEFLRGAHPELGEHWKWENKNGHVESHVETANGGPRSNDIAASALDAGWVPTVLDWSADEIGNKNGCNCPGGAADLSARC